MIEYLIKSYLLLLPLIIGGVLHMVFVTKDLFPSFKIPLHTRWFGANKTWRGFVVMPLATIVGVYFTVLIEMLMPAKFQVGMSLVNPFLLGLYLGLAYSLFELPNSFAKRRLGIKEGTLNKSKWKILQVIVDQSDSGFGCILVLHYYMGVSWKLSFICLFIGTFTHLVINILLFLVGLRKEAL